MSVSHSVHIWPHGHSVTAHPCWLLSHGYNAPHLRAHFHWLQGNVMFHRRLSVILSTFGLMATRSLFILVGYSVMVTARSVRILLECFLVINQTTCCKRDPVYFHSTDFQVMLSVRTWSDVNKDTNPSQQTRAISVCTYPTRLTTSSLFLDRTPGPTNYCPHQCGFYVQYLSNEISGVSRPCTSLTL